MSLFGAVRIAIEGWGAPKVRRTDEPLRAIRSGAWADWARAGTAGPAVEGPVGAACVTRDSRPGRIVTAHDGSTFIHVCEPT